MAITVYPPYGSSSNPSYVITNTENTVSAPWFVQVARGLIPGVSSVNIFGYQASVGTSSGIPVWENTTAYTFPASAATLTIASTSASDTSSKIVLIQGLDASYNQISETIALNGTSNVTSVNSYFRVNSVLFTNNINVGTITFKQGSNIVAQINPSIGKNQAAIYTVPAGYTFYGNRFTGFTDEGGGGNNYTIWLANAKNAVTGQNFIVAQAPFFGQYLIQRTVPFTYTEKTDIQWQLAVGTSTSPCGVNVEGILISNTAT